MWRSRQLLYVYLSQYNPQFEPVLLLCEDLKEFKSLNSNNLYIICPTRPGMLHMLIGRCQVDPPSLWHTRPTVHTL